MNLAGTFPLQGSIPVAQRPGVIRPYATNNARTVRASGKTYSAPVYDPISQTASYPDGTPLVAMSTSQKTNPDGDPKNPPPHDEGADPSVF